MAVSQTTNVGNDPVYWQADRETNAMQETCFCGRSGNLVEREPVQDEVSRWALQCPNPSCNHLDYLDWQPADVRLSLLDEAGQRRTLQSASVSSERAAD